MDIKFNNLLDLYKFSGAFRSEFSVYLKVRDDEVAFYTLRIKLLEIIYIYFYDFELFDLETYIYFQSVICRFKPFHLEVLS